MQLPEPRSEHQWLQQLVGEWTFESECCPGPDEPVIRSVGHETVRSLGGLWTVGEGHGDLPGGGACETIMTLGFNPATGQFVGTFIASVMTHLWPYSGTLDETGRILTLDSEGPGMADGGSMAKYQDVIEFLNENHRTLTSRMLGPDGEWKTFMQAHYLRRHTT
ncbi:MAG: DUF1579 domain-containing protein [Planctomycetaceae bacterium]|nr:DUF1579 domain-containing protein [Planctomycetaceae bacterium]